MPPLPPQLHVFVRDWLSANNVLLRSRDGNVLIDSGYADQSADRFPVAAVLRAGTTQIWGDLEWQMVAAPGHDMGAFVFYNPEYRVLISGDALWENGYGFVMPAAMDPHALPATRATLDTIAGLDVRVVIPGHGDVFTDVGAALERAYRRTAGFEADQSRLACYALKAVLAFSLLAKQRMPIADLPAYVERIGIYRDLNARCLRMSAHDLADMLVRDLEKAGAAARREGYLMPGGDAAG